MKKTLIIGASTKPQRYAYMAAERLLNKGHEIELLAKRKGELFDHEILTEKEQISKDIDTVTMYIGPSHQREYKDFILELKPKRVIFNPGTENFDLENAFVRNGIEVVQGCTLVMLGTGEF